MLWIVGFTFLVLWKLAIKIDGKVGAGGRGGRGRGGVGGKDTSFAKRLAHLLPFICLMMMVWAFYFAPLPFGLDSIAQLLANFAGWLLDFVTGWFGLTGGPIAAVLVLALVLLALWDLCVDGKPDEIAKTAVYALPVLVLVASGPIAPFVLDLIQTINSSTPRIAAAITGG
ncbi:hypothetical protein ACWGPQ_21935 [Saccharomonospora azurea]